MYLTEKFIFLSGFVTSSDSHTLSLLKDVSAFAVKAHTVRHTQNVVKRTLLVSKLHREWEAYARYSMTFLMVVHLHVYSTVNCRLDLQYLAASKMKEFLFNYLPQFSKLGASVAGWDLVRIFLWTCL